MSRQTRLPVCLVGAIVALMGGCRAQAPVAKAAPPASTQEACQQIRDVFKKYHATSDAPAEMSAGCHMHIPAGERVSGALDRALEAQGWRRNPAFGKGRVPSEVAYETASTHCAVAKLVDENSSGGRLSGGIGIGGGSHLSTGFGLGLGIGSGEDRHLLYKIDCIPGARP